ncbi:MAG: hypothetical protein QM757_12135 [Paludibaculum sp.]
MVTTVLTEEAGLTILSTTVLFPSREVRDAVMKSGLEHGANDSFDKLEDLLNSVAAG